MTNTRWPACADATKALLNGYSSIQQTLEDFSNNNDQKAECRQQARGLLLILGKLETGMMDILWNNVLQRFQMTNASLQSAEKDLNKVRAL